MRIDFATEEDKNQVKDIWKYCFTDTQAFVKWYFDNKYQSENTLVVYEQNNIVSTLQLIPYKILFEKKEVEVSYVVGVDTLPEARGKGYVKHLLQKTIEVLRERQQFICILLPFEDAFYKKYGWETCYYQKKYKLLPQEIKRVAKPYGNLRKVDFQKDIKVLGDVYRQFIKNKNGCILRTTQNWQHILADFLMEKYAGYIINDEAGKVQGYIFYRIEDNVFSIFEMAYENEKAYQGLLWFAYVHSAQAKTIAWNAPLEDMLFAVIDKPQNAVSINPFVMARVVDVKEVLEMLVDSNPLQRDDAFTIYIEDHNAPWNEGVFVISNQEIYKQENVKAYDLRCTINVFTQMVMGTLTPSQAQRLGVLEVKQEKALCKAQEIFVSRCNFINDYY